MPLLSHWIKKTMENVSFSIVFLVRMTGLVARDTSVIAIVAQYAPIVSAAQVQVANIVCRQLKNCRKSIAVTKKRRTKSSFVGAVWHNLYEPVLEEIAVLSAVSISFSVFVTCSFVSFRCSGLSVKL